jgi:hypothetical protein
VSWRARVIGYGAAALLVVAGVVLVAVTSRTAIQVVGVALMGLGLVALTSLVFYEVGLSEDRERAGEAERAREAAAKQTPKQPHPRRLTRRRLRRRG